MADLGNTAGKAKDAFEEVKDLVKILNERLEDSTVNMESFNDALQTGINLSRNMSKLSEKSALDHKNAADFQKTATFAKRKELDAKRNANKLDSEAKKLAQEAAKASDKNKGRLEQMAKRAKQAANESRNLAEGFAGAATKAAAMAKALEVGTAVLDAMFTGLMKADEEAAKLAKDVNLTKSEANGLRQEFALVAFNSKELAITTSRLLTAFSALNDQLGTAQQFSMATVGTFSKLTELVGISAESAGNLAFAAERNGANFREVEENVLATSHELQRGTGIALNMQGVLEATGKVTGQLRAQLGGNPKLIAEAVTKAKLLGAEINDIVGASKQLLEFETSIESELEAELLTGKQLNLERARAAALTGDQATLADELAKNMGTFTDFTKMNTLQQDSLAKSMGMQTDQLSDMLFKQETMGMNAEQLRAVGKGELADRLEQVSAQEKLNLAQEKFQSLLADVAAIALPIVDAFGRMVQFISESKILMGALVGIMTALGAAAAVFAVNALLTAIPTIMASLAAIPFGIGIPLAFGAIAGLMAAMSAGESSVKMAEGGIVKPRPGGTLATIGEAGQAEAVIPLNKAKQMGFSGGGGSAQPVIIQNNWDAFAASNGRGRKGLGGTQDLQASPTFA